MGGGIGYKETSILRENGSDKLIETRSNEIGLTENQLTLAIKELSLKRASTSLALHTRANVSDLEKQKSHQRNTTWPNKIGTHF